MLEALARMLLKRLLGNPALKERVFSELRAAAAKSDTKLDDTAVDVLSEAWDVVVPVLITKL